MDKNTYLRKLRKALEGLPQSMIEEIISDYQEHFEFGELEGKTQEQISKELGNPKEVAKEYLGTKVVKHDKKVVLSISKVIYFIIFLVGLLTILPHLLKITTNVLVAIFWFLLIIIGIGVVMAAIIIFYFKRKFNSIKEEGFSFNFNSKSDSQSNTINKHYSFDPESIKTIKVTSVLENVKVVKGSQKDISVLFEGKSSFDYNHIVIIEEGSLLHINSMKKESSGVSHNQSVKLLITVPTDKIYNIEIDSAVGTVNIEGQYGHVNVENKTGKVVINGQQESVDIDCKMGSVKLYNFNANGTINVEMGNVTFSNTELLRGQVEVRTKMGSLSSDPSKLRFDYHNKTNNVITFDDSHQYLVIDSKMGNVKFM